MIEVLSALLNRGAAREAVLSACACLIGLPVQVTWQGVGLTTATKHCAAAQLGELMCP